MYNARARAELARCLSGALLAGVWNERALVYRAERALDCRCWWFRAMVRAVLTAYPRSPGDRPRELARYIDLTLARLQAHDDEPAPPQPRRWYMPTPEMGRRRWPVPEIPSTGDLARFLEVQDSELAWLSDVRMLERASGDDRLRNYWYGTIRRPARPVRVIERPKHRLKTIQRQVLHEILDWIPVHEAAHGFTRGRSVASHALAHAGKSVVIRIDLQDFFASIPATRIYGIFRSAGYPESVAHTLTGLSTNVVPASFWHSLPRPSEPRQVDAHHLLGRQLATPHLPQGAPTSPALANLAVFNLDRRLDGLAKSLEANYTRYADDLTFSGSRRLVRQASLLRRAVTGIAAEAGFRVNQDKSTLVTQAGRQIVCGVVVNQHLNTSRQEYDRLKAILHNSITSGPASQNHTGQADFRAHLLGRIAWVSALNPNRGAKLHQQFALIAWGD